MSAKNLILEYTIGIRNALHRHSPKLVCPSCDFAVPKYPGRYPGKCPECGEMLEKYEKRKVKEDLQNAPAYSENSPWDAQMRRIPQDYIEDKDDDLITLGLSSSAVRHERVADGIKFSFPDNPSLELFADKLVGAGYANQYALADNDCAIIVHV